MLESPLFADIVPAKAHRPQLTCPGRSAARSGALQTRDRYASVAVPEKRLAAIDEVVECWEVSGTVDYMARFVCADLAAYEELTSALIDDENLGVARIVSHVALRPVRRFTGYPDSLLARKPAKG